ncbi:type II toxin-antitoxin system Rv0910 family toxin [Pseudofrankia inefficax]|uniref:Polyketide cyclase/dehydrase n=1 Tax=Pseudofrankia inefficax (strain DSM 45817 / CECT 9037 / DDB 130130 / EuI1c) TaxID=298654 RepID=E3JAP9_PSEI1|nr:SRPBCC family protein [Pseudofrankia inefficax]ADP82241.1 Polyketide cyclase/dehydrase [Pseudofrankia inefficax]
MASISATKVYAAPVDKVWTTLTDLSRMPDWNTSHLAFPEAPPAVLEPSMKFTQKISNMGMPSEVRWTIVKVEAPNLLEFKGQGPMNVTVKMRYEVEAVDGGTQVTIANEFTGAMVRMAGKRLTQSGQADLEASLVKFAEVVE